MPTGKQNTFANRTLPDAVYVTVRRDQPVNLVGAFEKPVPADASGGYVCGSISCFDAYARKVYTDYTDAPAQAWTLGMEMENAERLPLPKLLEAVETFLKTKL